MLSKSPGTPKRTSPSKPRTTPNRTGARQTLLREPPGSVEACIVDLPRVRCPVCLDTPNPAAATSCGHMFCEACILGAVQAQRSCPVCRTHLNRRQIFVLQFLVANLASPPALGTTGAKAEAPKVAKPPDCGTFATAKPDTLSPAPITVPSASDGQHQTVTAPTKKAPRVLPQPTVSDQGKQPLTIAPTVPTQPQQAPLPPHPQHTAASMPTLPSFAQIAAESHTHPWNMGIRPSLLSRVPSFSARALFNTRSRVQRPTPSGSQQPRQNAAPYPTPQTQPTRPSPSRAAASRVEPSPPKRPFPEAKD
ncbi:hypothetical protein H4R34_002642 [Dimargaris verticillata]|uniref:RING-type domain-containing protein n=1 Tax=Dimargaris verticillata TaxID=2761393 RepID=A0A9W8B266_9FUNG|nr:hypothetical protein H4R34_002642 [Dimargaris verticillata]